MIARKHHGKSFKYCLFLIRLHIFFYLKNILDINLISRIFFKIVNNAKIYSMIYIYTWFNILQLDDLFIFDTTVYFLSTHLAVVKLACDLSPECNYNNIIDFLSRFPRSSSSHGVYKMYALASSFDKSASFHLKSSREWGSLRLLLT